MANNRLSERTVLSDAAQRKQSSREAKQQQILDATVRCVRLKGFHATSMTDIAREAKISVGVIYLYFENKEAILEAIASQDLAEMRAKFDRFEGVAAEDLMDVMIEGLDEPLTRHLDHEHGALALEMVVEAARNPKVQAIMQAIDHQGRELSQQITSRLGYDPDPSADVRYDIIATLFEGMMIRSVLNPGSDRKEFRDLFKKVFRYVLTCTD